MVVATRVVGGDRASARWLLAHLLRAALADEIQVRDQFRLKRFSDHAAFEVIRGNSRFRTETGRRMRAPRTKLE